MGEVVPSSSGHELVGALAEISRAFEDHPELVGAGGGSVSAKSGDHLLVTVIRSRLAVVQGTDFVRFDRRFLQASLDGDTLVLPEPAAVGDQGPVLSEAFLHHVMPGKFVAHLQPALVNQFSCCQKGRSLVQPELEGDVAWVDLVEPGLALAKTVLGASPGTRPAPAADRPRAVIIQNHGVLVSGATSEEVLAAIERLLEALAAIQSRLPAGPGGEDAWPRTAGTRALINLLAPALRGLLSKPGGPLEIVTFDDSDPVLRFVCQEGVRDLAMGGPVTFDQVRSCGRFPLWFEASPEEPPDALVARLAEAVGDHARRYQRPPVVVLVPGLGLFSSATSWALAESARLVYTDVVQILTGAARLGGVHHIPDHLYLRDYLSAAGPPGEGAAGARGPGTAPVEVRRAVGKVALVTGAAQGFGRAIAEDLIAQGGHVALSDLNAAGVDDAAKVLGGEPGQGRAIAIPMDVTSASSVAEAVHQVVRAYGGLDLLVVNAGVLRAASIKAQPEDDFDLTTAVNYKGYFLCAKYVVPVLATQHAVRPDHWSDIVQINSKSGLVGSNKNFAYAGSKFGGIGLTQSFALELIEDGVKVNSVCPGNFFDGPLWSDPDTGLFVQYLRTGKVPGAKTAADVRRFYEAKVPMGRGCTAADVMKAIYYLMDQQYETGQALPVTGGQVMLH